jgi:hypothetical protein
MLYKSPDQPQEIIRLRGARVKNREVKQKSVRADNNDSSPSGRGIGRREAVQRLLTGAGGTLIVPARRSEHTAHRPLADAAGAGAANARAVAADWTPDFFDAHQNESLTALAERIIPGSGKAQVNRFIDLLLTVDTHENQKQFLAALGAFDSEARSRFGHPFPTLSEDQQNQLLTAASTDKPGNAPGNESWSWFSVPPKSPPDVIRITLRDHFENLKAWIIRAYYSSEVGMRELGWTGQYMFETFPDCEHPDGHSAS